MQGEHLEICETISSDEECIGEYKNIFARTVDDTTIVLTVYSYSCNNNAAQSFANVFSAFRARQPRR